jgi:predicted ATP-dependent Lon-type protease
MPRHRRQKTQAHESIGNVEVKRDESAKESYVPVEDLTYMLSEPMRNPAFIDRVHGILT